MGEHEHEHEDDGITLPVEDGDAGGDDEHEHEEEETEHVAPEPELRDERGLTPEAMERRARMIEQAFGRYTAKVTDLYEDEALRLLPCPMCPDQHKGFVHLDFAGLVPDEVKQAVMLYLGIARERNYPQDPGTGSCQVCEGYGKVTTGSRVPGHETRTCPSCKGYGYMPPPTREGSTNGATPASEVAAIVVEALQVPEDADEWGEPRILPDGRENPNFGRMPNRKVPVEPYGITAGLTALDVAR